MASENPRDEGVASGQTFIFTHQEINYVIKVLDEILEAFVEELAPESTVILLTELLKRFNKVKFNNLIEVPIELDGKDLEMLVFDLEMIEMDILVDVWAPGGMSAEEYEEMALCCTILAKLIEDPEDSGGGSAAAT